MPGRIFMPRAPIARIACTTPIAPVGHAFPAGTSASANATVTSNQGPWSVYSSFFRKWRRLVKRRFPYLINLFAAFFMLAGSLGFTPNTSSRPSVAHASAPLSTSSTSANVTGANIAGSSPASGTPHASGGVPSDVSNALQPGQAPGQENVSAGVGYKGPVGPNNNRSSGLPAILTPVDTTQATMPPLSPSASYSASPSSTGTSDASATPGPGTPGSTGTPSTVPPPFTPTSIGTPSTPGSPGTSSATPSITPTIPPTYTIGLPTVPPSVTPIPDTNYEQQAIDSARLALLGQVNSLQLLTGTITGTLVSGLDGGRVTSGDGTLAVGLFPGAVALTDTMNVQIQPISFESTDPRGRVNGMPLAYTYQLTATHVLDGQRVERFGKDAVLVWNVDMAALEAAGVRGFPLHVYRFNEQLAAWETVPSQWNADTHQLIAQTPHFSIYAVTSSFDAVKNYLPSVQDFEVNLQSGTANVSYPLNIPPGPGNFGPKVMLSYNSGNIDRVDLSQQGTSSIGWGWALSTSYIAANQHTFAGCPAGGQLLQGNAPWTTSIVSDGINGDLVKGQDGNWHTTNESFSKIIYVPGSVPPTPGPGTPTPSATPPTTRMTDHWEAWDRDGNHYVFDLNALSKDSYYDAAGNPCTETSSRSSTTTYRWMLHSISDTHGNTIHYTYAYEPVDNTALVYMPPTTVNVRAVYPYKIEYGTQDGTGRYTLQVLFTVEDRHIGGVIDLSANDLAQEAAKAFYQSYRVSSIQVNRLPQGTKEVPAPLYNQLRRYDLVQDYSTVLTPKGTTTHYPHLTLDRIVPRGTDSALQLPNMTFRYVMPGDPVSTSSVTPSATPSITVTPFPEEDAGHLWFANNGYGGIVGFYYDAAGGDAGTLYRRVRAKRIQDGLGGAPPDPGFSNAHDNKYFYDYRGTVFNTRYISQEADPQGSLNFHPLNKEYSQFRGYGWVREQQPVGDTDNERLSIDHYFSQDDTFKGDEWRMQRGRGNTFTDDMSSTPTSDPAWTVSPFGVKETQDGDNGVWKVEPSSLAPTPFVKRVGKITDNSGMDASIRFQINLPTPSVAPSGGSYIEANYQLQNPANGDYWGLQVYRVRDSGSGENQQFGKVVWSSGGVAGSHDLYYNNGTQYPRQDGPMPLNRWMRVHLHTSPDGRMALELYEDGTTKNYIQIKSGDAGTDTLGQPTTIPRFATNQRWQFANNVTNYFVDSSNKISLWDDDYTESLSLYNQQDSVYTDKTDTRDQAIPYPSASPTPNPFVGTDNNTQSMNVRFVPQTESWSAKFNESPNLGGGDPGSIIVPKRGKEVYLYDDPTNGTRYGNMIQKNEYGDIDAQSTLDRSSRMEYFPNTTAWIVDRMAHNVTYQGIYGQIGAVEIAEAQNAFDGSSDYTVPPTRGDLTLHKLVGILNGGRTGVNSTVQYGYDSYGNQTSTTDPNNNTTTTTFEGFYHAFPTMVLHPNGTQESTNYDYTLDTVANSTDANNTVTYHTYDTFGRPQATWRVGNNGSGPNDGDTTHPNEQYTFHDVAPVTYTMGLTWTIPAPFAINYQKRQDATTNQYGWATRWYDGRGRTVEDNTPKVLDPALAQMIVAYTTYTTTGVISSTSMPYVVSGLINTYVQPDLTQPRTTRYYDQNERVGRVVNPDGSQMLYDYSQLLWVGTKDESGHQKWLHTDMLGRLDTAWNQDNDPTPGHTVTDLRAQYSYDLRDLLTGVVRNPGGSNSANTTITYDGLGRKSQLQDPDTGTWQYAYDVAGNLTEQKDPLFLTGGGEGTNLDHHLYFCYDTMERIRSKFYGSSHYLNCQNNGTNGTPDVKYSYDNDLGDATLTYSLNRLRKLEVTSGHGPEQANSHLYSYDFKGHTISETVNTAYTTRDYDMLTSYDVGDRQHTMTYPDPDTTHEVVQMGYNTQGLEGLPNQLSSNKLGTSYPVLSADYNAMGQLLGMQQGTSSMLDVLSSDYTYNSRQWLTGEAVTYNGGSKAPLVTVLNMGISYYPNGNVQTISNQIAGNTDPLNPNFTNTYSNDYLDRLSQATSTANNVQGSLFAQESYAFDALSRMTTRTIGSIQYNYSYGDINHIDAPTQYNGSTQNNSYSYDANGNQTGGTVKGVGQTRVIDAENRVNKVISGTVTLTFVYDGNSQRVIQGVTQGSTTTRTLYVGGMYEESITPNSSTPPYISYYMSGGKMVGIRRANQADPATNGQQRVVGDQLGSTTLILNASAPPSVVQRTYYKPYGEVAQNYTSTAPTSYTSKGYTGQRLDADSGLMYYGARFYDPALAYFISPDSIVPGSGDVLQTDFHESGYRAAQVDFTGRNRSASVQTGPQDAQELNRYSYVGNNPLLHADPTGHCRDDLGNVDESCTYGGRAGNEQSGGHYGGSTEKQIDEETCRPYGMYYLWGACRVGGGQDNLSTQYGAGYHGGAEEDTYGYRNKGNKPNRYLSRFPLGKVPTEAEDVYKYYSEQNKRPPPNYKGMGTYENDGRNGSEILPRYDDTGKPITYEEYDINSKVTGVARDTERVVIGSDGSAYYTSIHYKTFTRFR